MFALIIIDFYVWFAIEKHALLVVGLKNLAFGFNKLHFKKSQVRKAIAKHQTKVLNDSITVCMTVQLTNRSVPHIEDLEVQEEEENCEQLLLTYLLLCTAILCD